MWVPKNEHIKHLYAKRTEPLSQLLQTEFQLSTEQTQLLLELGSVWVRGERFLSDHVVREGDYLRVHLYPRRFPVNEINWSKTILEENAEFVVMDKPAGIPVPSTVDNFKENCAFQLGLAVGQTLLVTQRLDRPTRGILLLAKTKVFQSKFNSMLAMRGVNKRYLALTSKKIEPGQYEHFMEESKRAPKVVSREKKDQWHQCLLKVERVCELPNGFEHEVNLLTGRTHQIRAQFSDLGAPIWGDVQYGGVPSEGYHQESIGLCAVKLDFLNYSYEIKNAWEVR